MLRFRFNDDTADDDTADSDPIYYFISIFLAHSEFLLLFALRKWIVMRTAKDYIDLISDHEEELRSQFGIRSLRLFGSVSRGEQREDSDVDICVDMEPSLYLMVRLKRFLEQLLQWTVDIVRLHRHINPNLLEDIERDGIYVIR